ncbi:unnamed protein product [Albugo candida]|uniref:Uncharacterized protein n=1 Tax=Albugo candida TaxID=65357 RepID=A0A024GDH2_9STRA|nr:unnamed protein product [Albugo candida]|eukprot:CCI44818.1 unnamed protein product [Albugo candida]
MLGQITKKVTQKIVKANGSRNISRSSMRMGGDEHHQHYVFEGDFSRKWVTGLAIGVVGGGVGIPFALVKYQNWKNGFPRKD